MVDSLVEGRDRGRSFLDRRPDDRSFESMDATEEAPKGAGAAEVPSAFESAGVVGRERGLIPTLDPSLTTVGQPFWPRAVLFDVGRFQLEPEAEPEAVDALEALILVRSP